MISRDELKAALDRLGPWRAPALDWRRLPNGRLVRRIDWKRLASEARR